MCCPEEADTGFLCNIKKIFTGMKRCQSACKDRVYTYSMSQLKCIEKEISILEDETYCHESTIRDAMCGDCMTDSEYLRSALSSIMDKLECIRCDLQCAHECYDPVRDRCENELICQLMDRTRCLEMLATAGPPPATAADDASRALGVPAFLGKGLVNLAYPVVSPVAHLLADRLLAGHLHTALAYPPVHVDPPLAILVDPQYLVDQLLMDPSLVDLNPVDQLIHDPLVKSTAANLTVLLGIQGEPHVESDASNLSANLSTALAGTFAVYAMEGLLATTIITLAIWWASGAFVDKRPNEIQANNATNVTLTIYYETYCPDSEYFIIEQLYPVHASLREKLIVDFVPYGKADQFQLNGQTRFDCQHGSRECDVNMIHACAVREVCGERPQDCPWDQRYRLMEFVYCNMEQRDRKGTAEECTQKAGLETDVIMNCTKSDSGRKFLSHFGNRTSEFEPAISMHTGFVPSIAIDGIPNPAAFSDLRGEVCKTHPSIC
ncbi:uncharacterized protein LOC129003410 [Macrosteles quadrilineatus]|uniref:uncharacterized protein LOC129003410 n=1 Tax=Macrosteles quadrilineatus TaxID=74068 RepID=UPI0023E21ABA|nr:uncharacterized protein LOC129003410 [Macrosteles quadrilineatus]